MIAPVCHIPAVRGSDAWQSGLQHVYKPADELTEEDLDAMDASERAFALQWLTTHPNDHEQARKGRPLRRRSRTMKTQAEILAYIRAHSEAFDFSAGALVPYLDYEHAKPHLKEGVTAEQWEAQRSKMDDDAVKAELVSYMEFAWGKVQDHRSISASRSVDKCTAWAWLLDGDDAVRQIEAAGYAQYGAPKLAVICRRFGLPIPSDDDVQRMIRGERCGASNSCGCSE